MFKRYQTNGNLHFLTFSTHRRAPILPDHFLTFEHSLEQTRKPYHLEVHGFVLMPGHVHLLLSEPVTPPHLLLAVGRIPTVPNCYPLPRSHQPGELKA